MVGQDEVAISVISIAASTVSDCGWHQPSEEVIGAVLGPTEGAELGRVDGEVLGLVDSVDTSEGAELGMVEGEALGLVDSMAQHDNFL